MQESAGAGGALGVPDMVAAAAAAADESMAQSNKCDKLKVGLLDGLRKVALDPGTCRGCRFGRNHAAAKDEARGRVSSKVAHKASTRLALQADHCGQRVSEGVPRVPGMVAMSQQPMTKPTAELDTPMWSHSFVTVGITCGKHGLHIMRKHHYFSSSLPQLN